MNPRNFVVGLQRKVSRLKINSGFLNSQSDYLYSNYSSIAAKLIRPISHNIWLHYNFNEDETAIVNEKSEEITYELIIDVIAKIFSLFGPIFLVFYLLNNCLNEFYLTKYLLYNFEDSSTIILPSSPTNNRRISYSKALRRHKERYRNYTLKNFFLSFICHCGSFSSDIKKIHKKILKIISIENVLTRRFTLNYHECMSRFLISIDIFAPKRGLFISGDPSFNTFLGHFLTFIYIFFLCFLFYYVGEVFFLGMNPTKIIYENNMSYKTNYSEVYNNVPFMFYYSSWIDSSVQFIYNNRTNEKLNYTSIPNLMTPTKCTLEQLNSFNITASDKLVYYCSYVNRFIDPDNTNNNLIRFGLGRCEMLNRYDFNMSACKSVLNPDQSNHSNLELGFAIQTWQIDYEAPKNEYKKLMTIDTNLDNFSYNNEINYTKIIAEIMNYNWIEDDDIFVKTSNEDILNVMTSLNITTPNYFDTNHSYLLCMVEIDLSSTKKFVTRSYEKFFLLWNKVFLIGNLLLILLKYFYMIFDEYLFLKKFLRLFLNYNNEIVIEKCKEAKIIEKDAENQQNNINEFQRIFCFKFFFLNLFRKMIKPTNHNLQILQILYSELIQSLCYEQIIFQKSDEIHQVSYCERFDMLSDRKLFLIDTQEKFKTAVGGFLTIVFVILTIVFAYIFGQAFFMRRNPNVSVSSLYFSDQDLNYWKPSTSYIMLYMTKDENYPSYFVINNLFTQSIYELPNCTNEYFEKLGIKPEYDKYKYACIDTYSVFGKINELGNSERWFSISITSCQEWNTFKIFEYRASSQDPIMHLCPSPTIKSSKNIEVGVITKFQSFNKEIPGLSDVNIHYNDINDNGDLYSLKFDIWGNQLDDDYNWFWLSKETTFFTSLVSMNEVKFKGFNDGLFGRLSVGFYQYEDYYTLFSRTYLKFSDYFVNISTIVLILFSLLKAITKFFNYYFFLNHYQKFLIDLKNNRLNILKMSQRLKNYNEMHILKPNINEGFLFNSFSKNQKINVNTQQFSNQIVLETLKENNLNSEVKNENLVMLPPNYSTAVNINILTLESDMQLQDINIEMPPPRNSSIVNINIKPKDSTRIFLPEGDITSLKNMDSSDSNKSREVQNVISKMESSNNENDNENKINSENSSVIDEDERDLFAIILKKRINFIDYLFWMFPWCYWGRDRKNQADQIFSMIIYYFSCEHVYEKKTKENKFIRKLKENKIS